MIYARPAIANFSADARGNMQRSQQHTARAPCMREPARDLVEAPQAAIMAAIDRSTSLILVIAPSEAHLDRSAAVWVGAEHRCCWCCKYYNTQKELEAKCGQCSERPRGDTVSRRTAKTAEKRAERQGRLDQAKMEEGKLANLFFNFVCLGHTSQADGDEDRCVEIRIMMAQANARFGKLHNVRHSGQLSTSLKPALYKHAVISTPAHGNLLRQS